MVTRGWFMERIFFEGIFLLANEGLVEWRIFSWSNDGISFKKNFNRKYFSLPSKHIITLVLLWEQKKLFHLEKFYFILKVQNSEMLLLSFELSLFKKIMLLLLEEEQFHPNERKKYVLSKTKKNNKRCNVKVL